jgi:hypothetical protein
VDLCITICFGVSYSTWFVPHGSYDSPELEEGRQLLPSGVKKRNILLAILLMNIWSTHKIVLELSSVKT